VEIQRAKIMASAKMSSIGEMSAGISHEINNRLAIILGKTNQLIRKIEKGEIEKEKNIEELKKIEETANRIGKIVRGLRSISRESSQDPLEKIYLENHLEEVLDLCQERFRKNNIEFRTNFQKGIFINGRPAQLSQVILNLLNNSFDAVEGKTDAWVSLSTKETDPFIEIEVKDSRKGIPKEISEKIMEPFFTTKDPGKGTDLGLSISSSIIQSFHGRLWLDAKNENTRFVIELPKIV
jgi:C4-dicarboxylate-specific signal transduction histidine kinase